MSNNDTEAPPTNPTLWTVLALVTLSEPIRQNKNMAHRVVSTDRNPSIPCLFSIRFILASLAQLTAWLLFNFSGIDAVSILTITKVTK
ncbi:hypothetical protein TL16_g12450 [Triparma laevis f. inornata]|uniref:Uncharacterized protein n=1 Tax=Triparma laevis f. inornata TaxID=1714386 RepID=A0A9W7BS88_9STRA|nr:hypothetical protein TL16_g12450 [Triparma laevis f. inornata]